MSGKYLWELLLDLANWKYHLKDYYHYNDLRKNKHKEDTIKSIIDKVAVIKMLLGDIKRYLILNNIGNYEKEIIIKIMTNIETGLANLDDAIQVFCRDN